MKQQLFPGGVRFQAPTIAPEQRTTDDVLQTLYLHCDGGLTPAHTSGGGQDTATLHHGHKTAQKRKIERFHDVSVFLIFSLNTIRLIAAFCKP